MLEYVVVGAMEITQPTVRARQSFPFCSLERTENCVLDPATILVDGVAYTFDGIDVPALGARARCAAEARAATMISS
jgi:hypothetical protein